MGNQDYLFKVSVRDKGGVGNGQFYDNNGMLALARNEHVRVFLQQTKAAAFALFTCLRCSWQGKNSRDVRVPILSEGGSNGYLEWRTPWLEGAS